MNIHLVGSIVDSPEIFWRQPDLEPLYSAARSYLEIPQRIDLLNTRVEVLQDMLQLLKDQVTSSHSEYLEIVVILLIMLEKNILISHNLLQQMDIFHKKSYGFALVFLDDILVYSKTKQDHKEHIQQVLELLHEY